MLYNGFHKIVKKQFHGEWNELKPVMEVIRAFPYVMTLTVTTQNGNKQDYRIVHAWYDKTKPESDQLMDIIWSRQHIFSMGYSGDGEILVHGHTPTIVDDYKLRSIYAYKPGMIVYRPNCINVDGGCFFSRGFQQYACMLCAICLETLEEIYHCDLEERIKEQVKNSLKNDPVYKRYAGKIDGEEIISELFEDQMEKYRNKKEDYYRLKMLERI